MPFALQSWDIAGKLIRVERVSGGIMGLKTILAVDDDEDVRQLYRRIFSGHAARFSLKTASSGQEALECLSGDPCDCLILDLGMKEVNGFEVLKQVRSNPGFKALPVLVVTGSKIENDGVRSLEMGADDYIVKPFSPAILEAKVERIFQRAADLRRPGAGLNAAVRTVLEAGPLKIDRVGRKTYVRGKDVYLSDKEFSLLYCICRRAPDLVRWEELHQEVWQYFFNEISVKQSQVLQVTLSRLRLKLGSDIASAITVQRGAGVVLELEVLRAMDGRA